MLAPGVAPGVGAADLALNPVDSGSGTNVKMFDFLAAGLPTDPAGGTVEGDPAYDGLRWVMGASAPGAVDAAALENAITVVIALVSAMILSVTFVPASVALLFRKPVQEKNNLLVDYSRRIYKPLLVTALRFRWSVVILATLLVVVCASLATRLGSEFVPDLDEGDRVAFGLRGFPGEQHALARRRPAIAADRAVAAQHAVARN